MGSGHPIEHVVLKSNYEVYPNQGVSPGMHPNRGIGLGRHEISERHWINKMSTPSTEVGCWTGRMLSSNSYRTQKLHEWKVVELFFLFTEDFAADV